MKLGSVAVALAAATAIDLGSASPSFAAGATNYVAGVDGGDSALLVWKPGIPFASKGGILAAAPAIAANPEGTSTFQALYVVTGSDHNLYVRNDSTGYQVLNSSRTVCLDNPAAVVTGTTLTVACQGGDHALYYSQGTVNGDTLPTLSGWTSLGGTLVAGPAVAPVFGQGLTFLANGTDGHIWSRTTSTGFTQMPWRCLGHPALAAITFTEFVQPLNDTITIHRSTFACDGTDHALWSATNAGLNTNPGVWSSTQRLGGVLIDGPGVASDRGGVSYLVEGSDHAIYQNDGTAGAFTRLGGVAQFGVGAAGVG